MIAQKRSVFPGFDPDSPVVRIHRANVLKNTGRLTEAIEAYDQILRDNPNCTWAIGARAFALARAGRIDDAILDYKIFHEREIRGSNLIPFPSLSLRPLELYHVNLRGFIAAILGVTEENVETAVSTLRDHLLSPNSLKSVETISSARSSIPSETANALKVARLSAAYELLVRRSDFSNPLLSKFELKRRAGHLLRTYQRLRKANPGFRDTGDELRAARRIQQAAYRKRRKDEAKWRAPVTQLPAS